MSRRNSESDQAEFLRKRCSVKILRQPKGFIQFSHRTSETILSVCSTQEKKTFPIIRVDGFIGKTMVVVSCVTRDEPYRPHPFNLVGGKSCNDGVCTLMIPADTMMVELPDICIQYVKRPDVKSSLSVREAIKVDPFATGFYHKHDPNSIDLNAVRLCFQVFLEGNISGDYCIALQPEVSQPIFNKIGELFIVKLSECSYPVDSDKELILLCKKVDKNDVKIRFIEEMRGKVIWEAYADFKPSQVHYSSAISFKPPRYHNLAIKQGVKVFVQLVRPSNSDASERLPFEFLPGIALKRQLKQIENSKMSELTKTMNIWLQKFAADITKHMLVTDKSVIEPSETIGISSMSTTCSELPIPPTTNFTFSNENMCDQKFWLKDSTSTRPQPLLSAARSHPFQQYCNSKYAIGALACSDVHETKCLEPNVTTDLDRMSSGSPDKHCNTFRSHSPTYSVSITKEALEMLNVHEQEMRTFRKLNSCFNDYEGILHIPS